MSSNHQIKYMYMAIISCNNSYCINSFCSEKQIRKKAGVLFGIRIEGNSYEKLEGHLQIIKSNKDLVSVTFKTVIFETFSIIRICPGKKS